MEGVDFMRTKRYVIVNAINNVPIRRTGFCTVYQNQKEAEISKDNWNKMAAIYGLCTAKVSEVIR